MLDEGVYGLSFATSDGDGTPPGEGIAVLRGGKVLGSDPHGGVFKGRYRYDAARDEAVVEVRLAVPPNGVLLTGLSAGPGGAFVDVSGRFRAGEPVSSMIVDVAGQPMTVGFKYMGPLRGP